MSGKILEVAELIYESDMTVALSGAGMSTESGIADFRTPGTGLWEKIDPMEFGSIDSFLTGFDMGKMIDLLKTIDISSFMGAKPNDGHKALAELERVGLLKCMITQNIDMLHSVAGNKDVIELHGSFRTSSCMNCGKEMTTGKFIGKVIRTGKIPPICECGGIIKPDVVFFGETLPLDALSRSTEYAERCDLMIVVGSSLVVYPAASLPPIAKQNGAKLVIINMEPTPYDSMADIVIHGKCGEVLPEIVKELESLI
ncbi:MAG: NAD-dependent deacylase [Halobacteriota archaeon]|nr:NAD-dependent deacylase [Halobacteriota archaeon]